VPQADICSAATVPLFNHLISTSIAFAVEDAKIALSDRENVGIDFGFIEGGLTSDATRAGFDRIIEQKTARLFRTAATCIADAGLSPTDIQTIFFTGGSSRVPAVRAAVSRAAPEAQPATGSDLLSVALGLTRETEPASNERQKEKWVGALP